MSVANEVELTLPEDEVMEAPGTKGEEVDNEGFCVLVTPSETEEDGAIYDVEDNKFSVLVTPSGAKEDGVVDDLYDDGDDRFSVLVRPSGAKEDL